MAKTTRKSAMPGNVTNRQVAKVEKRKAYNEKVTSYNKSVDERKKEGNRTSPLNPIDTGIPLSYISYKKPKSVVSTDKGKTKVVKQSWKSQDLKNKKAVGKQNKKFSKTVYK
jgi:hypothetical protein